MRFKLIILLIIIVTNALAISLDERRKKIITIIDRELNEVSRLARNVKRRDPSLLLRMAELNLEKARLWKEKENEDYLAIPSSKRAKVNKNSFFRTSSNFFVKAKKLCEEILKRFKRFSGRADAYYILAYHYKEFNNLKKARKYFELANRKSGRKSMTKTKSQVALAEIYYNKAQYKRAIPLYERSLRSHVDKWWTKDAFNLAWSYLRTGRANKGLTWMKNIYQKSKDKKYIDMSRLVVRDIGLFYAEAGRVNEAIDFYKKENADFTEQILKLSGKLPSTQSIKVLRIALKYEKRPPRQVEVQMALAEVYNKFSKYFSLEIVISSLTQKSLDLLNQEQRERLIYLAEKNAAELQKKVVGKLWKKVPRTKWKYAKLSAALFQHLVKLNPKKSAEYEYFNGETYFSINRMTKALTSYKKSFDISEKEKNGRFKKLAQEGMLACLGSRYLPLKVKNKNYVEVYERSLRSDSRSNRAIKIYEKLFKVHYDDGDLEKSIATLNKFKASFPANLVVQEAMVASIMESYRKANNDRKVKEWIEKIDNKEYRVSSKYRNKLRVLLTNIQMKNVEVARNRGDKAKALQEYLVIFSSKDSTKSTKKNSAYNISVLYYELGDVNKVFEWANKTLGIMSVSEVRKFRASFVTFTSFLFEKMEFNKSAELSENTLNKLCLANAKEKEQLFTNAIYLRIAEKKYQIAEQSLAKFSKCGIRVKTKNDVYLELADIYLKEKNWPKLESTLNILDRDRKLRHKTLWHLNALIEQYDRLSDSKKVAQLNKKFSSRYYSAKKRSLNIPVKVRSIVAGRMFKVLERDISRAKQIKLRLPFKTLQAGIEKKAQAIDRINKVGLKIISEGADNYMVKTYSELVSLNNSFADEVNKFNFPKGTDKNIIKNYHKAFGGLYRTFYKQARDLKKAVTRDISKYSLISEANASFASDGKFQYQFSGANNVFMEREGSKW